MKDPIRLLEGAATDAERTLLGAAMSEEPPSDGAQRLAAALGLSVALVSVPAATAHASASVAPPAAGAGLLAGKGMLLAWLAAGIVAVSGGAWVLRGTTPSPSPTLTPNPTSTPIPTPTPAPTPAPTPDSNTDTTNTTEAKSIAREITQLDSVRAALHRGDARAALARLDAYGTAHRGGVLKQEAMLLRIEALAQAGEGDAARALAKRFLREHPKSPHVERARALGRSEPDAR